KGVRSIKIEKATLNSHHFELLSLQSSSSMSLIQIQPPSSQFLNIKFNPKLSKPTTHLNFTFKFSPYYPLKRSFSLKISSNSSSFSSSSPSPSSSDNFHSSSISSLQTIKPYIQSEWKLIIQGWTCSAVSVFCLSKIIPKAGKFSSILGDNHAIKCDGAILAAFFAVRLAANYLQQAFLWEASFNSTYKIRAYVFRRVLEQDLGFFEGGDHHGVCVSPGDISHRITSEASDVADTVFALLNTIVPSTLQLSAMAAQMLVISPILSTISALVIPTVALAIAFLGVRLQRISRKAHISFAALSSYLNEVLPSILFVKASNMVWTESIRFKRLAHADLISQLKKRKIKALIPQIVQAVYFGALLLFFAGSLALSRGPFNICRLISFVTSLVFLVEPIQTEIEVILQGVGKAYNELKQGEPAIERLFDLTRFRPQARLCLVVERSDAICVDSIRGEVKFCDVSFQYGDDLPLVFNGINLHIRAGERVALVGPSGGGKTTLAKLLLRLYDPLHGRILIDGHDIQDFRLESLRSHVALVSQDIMLFSGTVAENIGYRDLMGEIDLEKVKLAAKIANADEFICLLPRAYKTNIGSRGSRLSGGQKQRLAIARAVYKNASILVMDEATSALDSKSELLVRQAVERVMKNHTVRILASTSFFCACTPNPHPLRDRAFRSPVALCWCIINQGQPNNQGTVFMYTSPSPNPVFFWELIAVVAYGQRVLVIAHRLETVLMAERVFLLEAGKLREIDRSTLINSSHDLQSSANLVI
ncbi:ABC transporter B family member 29 chloroplastic, partial [Bienertia sinuspersici]